MLRSLASRPVIAAVTVLALGWGLTGCDPARSAPEHTAEPAASAAPVSVPQGTQGAVDYDGGYIAIGSGPKVVDLYVDAMCPYCKMFEQSSGGMLVDEARAGHATVRVHPVAILNRLSRSTDYSTRAAAVFASAAALTPDAAADVLAAFFSAQPDENTEGLTDEQLIELAIGAGVDTGLREADLRPTRAWVDAATADATAGPLPTTTDIASIRQVPTALVDGRLFAGGSDEKDAFAAFYAGS